MDLEKLIVLTRELRIAKDQIIREEAEMVFLNELANDPLSSKLAFYGGTALRLAYNSPRFSEDIDLIALKPADFSDFKSLIRKTAAKNGHWRIVDLKDKRNTMFAVFSIKDEMLKHNFSVKIEGFKPSHVINLRVELSLIKSPASIFEPLLLVPVLSELKKMKEQAISSRKKARDIFDLWYIAQTMKTDFILPKDTPRYPAREFRNELQVYLPGKFHKIIPQLYGKINSKNK